MIVLCRCAVEMADPPRRMRLEFGQFGFESGAKVALHNLASAGIDAAESETSRPLAAIDSNNPLKFTSRLSARSKAPPRKTAQAAASKTLHPISFVSTFNRLLGKVLFLASWSRTMRPGSVPGDLGFSFERLSQSKAIQDFSRYRGRCPGGIYRKRDLRLLQRAELARKQMRIEEMPTSLFKALVKQVVITLEIHELHTGLSKAGAIRTRERRAGHNAVFSLREHF